MPTLKEMQFTNDLEWSTRWINIDRDRFALIMPGQGFLADKDGNIFTVTAKDIMKGR